MSSSSPSAQLELVISPLATAPIDDIPASTAAAPTTASTAASAAPTPPPTPPVPPAQRVRKFLFDNFLPLGFLLALIVAMSDPAPGKAVLGESAGGFHIVQTCNIICVFICSGITLNTKSISEVRDSHKAVVLGVVGILFLTPLLGLAVIQLPTHPREIATGAAIFCCTPTTLGVGVALTTAAGGNTSVALLLTIATNALGVFLEPYVLRFVLARGPQPDDASDVLQFNPGQVLLKMTITVLLPTVLGLGLNVGSGAVRAWVARHRTRLTLFQHANLVVIVWQTLSSAASALASQSAAGIVGIVALSSGLHVALLALFLFLCSSQTLGLALPVRDRIAVTIMASQKSAPVAITLIFYLTSNPRQQGLLAVPALVGQLAQIFIGSMLTRCFLRLARAEAGAGAGVVGAGAGAGVVGAGLVRAVTGGGGGGSSGGGGEEWGGSKTAGIVLRVNSPPLGLTAAATRLHA